MAHFSTMTEHMHGWVKLVDHHFTVLTKDAESLQTKLSLKMDRNRLAFKKKSTLLSSSTVFFFQINDIIDSTTNVYFGKDIIFRNDSGWCFLVKHILFHPQLCMQHIIKSNFFNETCYWGDESKNEEAFYSNIFRIFFVQKCIFTFVKTSSLALIYGSTRSLLYLVLHR